MNKRPTAINHMLVWAMLATPTIIISLGLCLLTLSTGSEFNLLLSRLGFLFTDAITWLVLLIAIYAGSFGGFVLGLMDGLLLRWLTRDVVYQFDQEDMQHQQKIAYPAVFMLTLLTSFILTAFLLPVLLHDDSILTFGFGFDAYAPIILFISPLIAATTATFASHRFIKRLHLWYSKYAPRKRKFKPKWEDVMIDRLADQAENDPVLDEYRQLQQRLEAELS